MRPITPSRHFKSKIKMASEKLMRNPEVTVDRFLLIARLILLVTLFSKMVTLIEGPDVLKVVDGVTALSFRTLLVVSSLFEACIIVALSMSLRRNVKALALLYFAMIVGVYRIVSRLVGQHWCPCLGSLANWLPLGEEKLGLILNAIVLFLLLGSLASLAYLARNGKFRLSSLKEV